MLHGVRSGNEVKQIMVKLMSNNGNNGSVTTNPFNFEHFNVEQINLTVDACKTVAD